MKWLQKWKFVLYVFRRYQVGDLTTNLSTCCAMILCRFGQLRNSSVFTHFILSAALLQSVLQANTEIFQKGIAETSKTPSSSPILPQMERSELNCTFWHETLNFNFLTLSYLMNCISIFQKWEILSIFCFYQYSMYRRENKHFDVRLWRIRPVRFPSKIGKRQGLWENRWMGRCLFLAWVGTFLYSW